jgi:hypothetical protein
VRYEVEVHNLSTGERRIVCYDAPNKEEALRKALRRQSFTDDLHKGYLFTFRVDFAGR